MLNAVSKTEFKPRSLEYFRRVEQTGEELVITDKGRPVLKVIRYVDTPEDYLQELRNTVLQYNDPLEPVGADCWEALK